MRRNAQPSKGVSAFIWSCCYDVTCSRPEAAGGVGPPLFSPLKSFIDFESEIEQWLIWRYITIHSFSGIAVHETWHGTSVGGGSLTSERERSDQSHSSWSDPNGSC